LALSPDTPNESFLREVDENLRRDQMEQFAKRYAKWLIGLVVLILVAFGGYLYWQQQQQKNATAQSEQLMGIYNDIGQGKVDLAKKKLQPFEKANSDVVRTLTLLTEAAIALDNSDRATALAKYRSISADGGIPQPYRDLATLRATALEFDKPGNPWFGTAGELTAMAYLKQGHKQEAGRLFAAISADKQVPDTIRSRAVQIAGTLGVDASAAQTSQPGSSE
jgi:hypothetical protein